MDVAHQGSVVVQKGVEQGRLAHVGLAHYCHGDAVLDGIAHGKRLLKARYLGVDVGGECEEAAAVGKFHFFLAEIEFKLHERHKFQQLLAELCQAVAKLPAHLAECDAVGGLRRRGYEVGNGFGL